MCAIPSLIEICLLRSHDLVYEMGGGGRGYSLNCRSVPRVL